MMEEKPNYYAVIPATVRYDQIPDGAKLLYGEITALCSKEGYCWATNEYFSRLYGKTERTIGRWIKQLEKREYIRIMDGDSKNRKFYIDKNVEQPRQKCQSNPDKNVAQINTVSTTVITPSPAETNRAIFNQAQEAMNGEKREWPELQDFVAWAYPKFQPLDKNDIKKQILKFVAYWTEPTPSGKKQRWQTEKTFDIRRRFFTWMEKADKFSGKGGSAVNKRSKKGVSV